jgi:uncharacterized protein YutE (UPF0331/DUF86 family)
MNYAMLSDRVAIINKAINRLEKIKELQILLILSQNKIIPPDFFEKLKAWRVIGTV